MLHNVGRAADIASQDPWPLSQRGQHSVGVGRLFEVDLEIDQASGTPSQIKAFGKGARASARDLRHEEELQRPLNITGKGATRTRTFHSKLNDAALALMDQSINKWIDSAEIEIKSVSTCIGIFEGKKPEPHLLVTVFY